MTKFDYAGERTYYASSEPSKLGWRWLEKDMANWVPNFPDAFAGKRVLDIGAGECLVTCVIADAGRAKIAVGLELIHHRLKAAPQAHLPALSLACGDCFSLPFPARSVDIVVGNGVLHHLPDELMAIEEIGRVLRPGGSYFGREPNFQNLLVRRRVLGGHHSPNEHALITRKLATMFQKCGLNAHIRYFWRRLSWLHHPWLSVSIAITATKNT